MLSLMLVPCVGTNASFLIILVCSIVVIPNFVAFAESLTLEKVPLLDGTLPTEFGLLTNATSLKIKIAPNLMGTLPTELGRMTSLTSLSLSSVNRVGTLPVEYSQLTKLQTLDFYDNQGLTGTLPTEYGKLVNLSKSIIVSRCLPVASAFPISLFAERSINSPLFARNHH
jgi:hypothetical protein